MKITITGDVVLVEEQEFTLGDDGDEDATLQLIHALTWGMRRLAETTQQLSHNQAASVDARARAQHAIDKFRLGMH